MYLPQRGKAWLDILLIMSKMRILLQFLGSHITANPAHKADTSSDLSELHVVPNITLRQKMT